MDAHPRQLHAGLHHAVWWPQQEVTRPKARFKSILPKMTGLDGGANQVPTYLGQLFHLHSPWSNHLFTFTRPTCTLENVVTCALSKSEHLFRTVRDKTTNNHGIHGGGKVVTVIAFYSDDTSSNPTEVYIKNGKMLSRICKLQAIINLMYIWIHL